jgi:hypothetical protein
MRPIAEGRAHGAKRSRSWEAGKLGRWGVEKLKAEGSKLKG